MWTRRVPSHKGSKRPGEGCHSTPHLRGSQGSSVTTQVCIVGHACQPPGVTGQRSPKAKVFQSGASGRTFQAWMHRHKLGP